MSNTTVEAIDLQVGMVYRRFTNDDWATIKAISYNFKRGAISGINIKDAEGGGCSIGAHGRITIKEVE